METTFETPSMSEVTYWDELSQARLTDKEVLCYAEKLNWRILSEHGNFSYETWWELQRFVMRDYFSKNKHVGIATYKALSEKVSWSILAAKREIDESFLRDVPDEFPSLSYAWNNPSAKNISDKTWAEIKWKNGRRLGERYGDNKLLIRKQLFNTNSLSYKSEDWTEKDWNVISHYQPIDEAFVEKFADKINHELLELNKLYKKD